MKDSKAQILSAIQSFGTGNLFENSTTFFTALGYNTERQNRLSGNSYKDFRDSFIDTDDNFNEEKSLSKEWNKVELLFQLTNEEVTGQGDMFSTDQVDNTIIESYLFFAIELKGKNYSRTKLAQVTREVNKLFNMPAMILFMYDEKLTLSIINRRLHKRDSSKDVLEKVTLIKDIRISNPHRAHLEILFDLSLDEIYAEYKVKNFVELHRAWQQILDTSELNKRFFKELSNWFFWAIDQVEFPDDEEKSREKRNPIAVIRLITRFIFVWFIKEKGLVPDKLFDRKEIEKLLDFDDVTGSSYYKAILQNLFFATLNTEMNRDKKGSRRFINGQFLVHYFYRYTKLFKDKENAIKLFEDVPFLNGGLFECLDRKGPDGKSIRIDCFSENPKHQKRLTVPDYLFFGNEKEVDLSEVYGDKRKNKEKVRPLIDILNSYKFTIAENTPIEEEVALDPELLGKVFENLLASYNPETKTTARKQTGSFYTPREIVNYMVDESLIAYLLNHLPNVKDAEKKLRQLFEYNEQPHEFDKPIVEILINAIDNCKILDPACGSGAFPMGILHRLVFLLHKLDPHNEKWKQKQLDKAMQIDDADARENLLEDIEESFAKNEMDYGRKLFLIENCIYGVDIQPIAGQIAKLRFFISLIVDQRSNPKRKNFGIRPLPNLETKFVAADTLRGIDKPAQMTLRNPAIDAKEEELHQVRERHFTARTPKTKEKYRELDAQLRKELAELLEEDGFNRSTTQMLANWNPYDQNQTAGFFDPDWMFAIKDNFNVILGNPPYVSYYGNTGAKLDNKTREYYKNEYSHVKTANDRMNSMNLMTERSLKILDEKGVLFFITNKTMAVLPSYKNFRDHLLSNYSLKVLVDHLDPFDAIVDCIIIGVSPGTDNKPDVKYFNGQIETYKPVNQDDFNENPQKELAFSENNAILNEIEKCPSILSDILTINRGVNIGGCFDQFLSTSNSRGYFPYLGGTRNIKPFQYIIDESDGFFKFDMQLEQILRNDGATIVLGNPERYLIPRLFIPESGQHILAAYCDEQIYGAYGLLVGTNDSVQLTKAACTLLNSNVLTFYCVERGILRKGNKATPHVGVRGLNSVPVPELGQNQAKVLADFCTILTVAKSNGLEDEFHTINRVANAIVMEYYFPELFTGLQLSIADEVNTDFSKIQLTEGRELQTIKMLNKKWTAPDSPVKNSIKLLPTKSPDFLKPILQVK